VDRKHKRMHRRGSAGRPLHTSSMGGTRFRVKRCKRGMLLRVEVIGGEETKKNALIKHKYSNIKKFEIDVVVTIKYIQIHSRYRSRLDLSAK